MSLEVPGAGRWLGSRLAQRRDGWTRTRVATLNAPAIEADGVDSLSHLAPNAIETKPDALKRTFRSVRRIVKQCGCHAAKTDVIVHTNFAPSPVVESVVRSG